MIYIRKINFTEKEHCTGLRIFFLVKVTVAVDNRGSSDNQAQSRIETEKSMPEYILTEHEIIHFIELPKYEKLFTLQDRVIHPMLKKWIEFFLYEGKEDEKMKVLLTDSTIKKAHEEYQKFTADEKMQRLYDARWKQMMDNNSLMASARKEGLEQGFQEGLEKGIEKGVEIGIAEGEYNGRLKTARRMLEAGLSVDDIAKLTTLSLQEIEKLKEN